MISEWQMKQVLEQALSSGGDFAELFFEERDELNIKFAAQAAQGAASIRIFGAGLHLMAGERRAYVYANDIHLESLLSLARQASNLIKADAQRGVGVCDFRQQPAVNPNAWVTHPSTIGHHAKLKLLQQCDLAARDAGICLPRLAADYFDTSQKLTIVNSDGLLTGEQRVTSRIRLQVTLENMGASYYVWEDFTRPQGFEAFRTQGAHEAFARDVVVRAREMMDAGSVPSCTVPVILEAGSCGTLWHECCGHTLEASAIASRRSAFTGKIGETVASAKVTLVDDGTLPGLYGSSAIDDEGRSRQRNVLIENGILKTYLCDNFHGRLIGMPSNGCGRRQNFTYAPTSRMSNTFLAAGHDDDEEMIRSLPEGLFVRRIGGGTGGLQFSLEVKEGFWIRNGQIDRPVKGLTLTGSGIDIMKKVDRVGKRLIHESNGGFCGAESGLIPTTTSQPRVRIAEMTIGGEGER